MSAHRYRIQAARDLPRPSITRMDTGTPVTVRGPNLADAVDALLEDATGKRWPFRVVGACAVVLFGTGDRAPFDDEITASRLLRVLEMVRGVEAGVTPTNDHKEIAQ